MSLAAGVRHGPAEAIFALAGPSACDRRAPRASGVRRASGGSLVRRQRLEARAAG